MRSTTTRFPGVVLPGSVPLPAASDVFRWAGKNYGPWLHRVPDGETGETRFRWIQSQTKEFQDNPTLDIGEPDQGRPFGLARTKDGVEPAFSRFSYADWAQESYRTFVQAREQGLLPAGIRFAVAMPHPMDTVWIMVEPDSFGSIYPVYEAQALAAAREVAEVIPHEDLTIQWDVPLSCLVWADSTPNPFASKQDVVDALLRAIAAVPDDVELGLHLCYGDRAPMPPQGPALAGEGNALKVVQERDDASALASLINTLAASVQRPIGYIHIPTDAGWLEPHHYEPLAELNLSPDTELHVGVVAFRLDGDLPLEEAAQRARQRAASVRSVLGNVGLSSSCGLGRNTPEQFEASAALIRELAGVAQDAGSHA